MSAYESPVMRITAQSPRPRNPGILSALFWLGRPRLALWVGAIPLFGYAFGHWDADLVARRGSDLALLLLAWCGLSSGTMWLNAALDQTERSAVFARGVAIPPSIMRYGFGALAMASVLSALADPLAGVAATAAAVLSILYSNPRTAYKGHPILGPLINLLGYGVLSPIAGWALSGAPVTVRAGITVTLWSLWMLGAYLAAQVFQGEEDGRRGYETWVVAHGPLATLRAARACMNLAIGGFFLLALAGVYPRLTLFACPIFVWADAHTGRWLACGHSGDAGWAERLYRRMLVGGLALTILTYVQYWFAWPE